MVMSFSLCGLSEQLSRCDGGYVRLVGIDGVTETSGRPMSRTFWSRPWRAAWSATGPEMTVVPSGSLVRVSPSNQAAQRASRCP